MTDIDKIGLIKWPAFLVKGKRVTEQQAAEIIIRTDRNLPDFRYAGNDEKHAQRLSDLFGVPADMDYSDAQENERTKEMHIRWASIEALENKLGKLSLTYLHNSRIVSCFIGGPHGWVDWDGEVGNCATNIGKWPSVEEVTEDWTTIAEAFPFLDLECQLCNHEAGYPAEDQHNGPVIKFIVKDGTVTVLPQDPEKDSYIVAPREIGIGGLLSRMSGGNSFERGISVADLKRRLAAVYNGSIPQYERVEPQVTGT